MNQVGDIIQIGPGAHYRLDHHIASATFGMVWSATWLEANTKVALKTVRYDYIENCASEHVHLWPDSLRREIDFLETIRAGHLVYFLRKGEYAGMPVLVLEELDTSLQLLTNPEAKTAQAVGLAQALVWLRQILLGMQAMHRRGLRHLDIKPNNLLLTPAGPLGRRIKIADFGEAKAVDTCQHPFCGTASWQAPEQFFPCEYTAVGFRYQTDHRADFFALGLLFFYLVTGEKTSFAKHMLALHQQQPEVGAWQAREVSIPTLSAADKRRFLIGLGECAQAVTPLIEQDDEESTWHPICGHPGKANIASTHAIKGGHCANDAALDLLVWLLAVRPEQRPCDAAAVIAVIDKIRA